MFDVVDLGTKQGGALNTFFATAGAVYLKPEVMKSFKKSKSIGFERQEGEKYRKDVEKKGFNFEIANLATDEAVALLPVSKVYLAWHFLEHLPNKEWSEKLVKAALTKSTVMAWFRLPSFEQDDITGEGVLRKLGLRFTWTNWHGHSSHWLVQDCVDAIRDWESQQERKFNLTIRPAGYIKTTSDKRVVPIDTPVDVNGYQPAHGYKPIIYFKQAVVAEWEVIVRFACE